MVSFLLVADVAGQSVRPPSRADLDEGPAATSTPQPDTTDRLPENTKTDIEALIQSARQEVAERNHTQAMALLDRVVATKTSGGAALYLRGCERLCVGDFAGSVADFDRYLAAEPNARARLWQRGIACYFAKKYEAGAKQFSAYQTFDGSDVENAVWHVLCLSQVDDFATASAKIMPVGPDRRVPMRDVYLLYAGQGSVDDVLARAEAEPDGPRRRRAKFYAHLYLGLYFDVIDERAKAVHHLDLATHKFPIDNYMWDVAKIALETRSVAKSQTKP